jgi:hypothetical protein
MDPGACLGLQKTRIGLTFHPLMAWPHTGGPTAHQQSERISAENSVPTARLPATAIVFRWTLQLFVPFAPKDAKLARGANQARPLFSEIREMKA